MLERFFQVDGAWRSYAASPFRSMENLRTKHTTTVYPDPNQPVSLGGVDFPEDFATVHAIMESADP